MEGDVIKSFLVGLGFGVDDASLAKFNKAIASASTKVAAMYGGIQLAASGIFYSLSKMSSGFEEIGYQLRLVAPAINKMLILRQAMISAYQAAGINLTKAVQQSILFNYSLAKTKFALEAVYKSVGIKFLPLLTKQMDLFRAKIFANLPKIQDHLTTFVNLIFRAFSATVQLGESAWRILERIYIFFKKLDEATGGWSTKILGFIAVWKLLNLSFLATPLGMILSGLLAIIALYDDFKVWEEGGKAFINWGSEATKIVVGLIGFVGALGAAFIAWGAAIRVVKGVMLAFEAVLAIFNGELTASAILLGIIEAPIWLIVAAIGALVSVLTIADSKWNIFGGKLSGFIGAAGGKILDFFKDTPSLSANNVHNITQPQPLISNVGGANQRVNQETNILVQGSADAAAVGKNVANEQSKVNFDMTRNLKGAMR